MGDRDVWRPHEGPGVVHSTPCSPSWKAAYPASTRNMAARCTVQDLGVGILPLKQERNKQNEVSQKSPGPWQEELGPQHHFSLQEAGPGATQSPEGGLLPPDMEVVPSIWAFGWCSGGVRGVCVVGGGQNWTTHPRCCLASGPRGRPVWEEKRKEISGSSKGRRFPTLRKRKALVTGRWCPDAWGAGAGASLRPGLGEAPADRGRSVVRRSLARPGGSWVPSAAEALCAGLDAPLPAPAPAPA